MKKKELERLLQGIPRHASPDPALEQYSTPAGPAADALFLACQNGDITGRSVADLGCGTGILAIGAKLLGAGRVIGIDIDPASVEAARRNAAAMDLDVVFSVLGVPDFEEEVDTVVMNPPFGAQKRHADRAFLWKAFEVASAVYSFHLAETEDFVLREARGAGFCPTHKNKYGFAIPYMFDFHRKERQDIEVVLLRMVKGEMKDV